MPEILSDGTTVVFVKSLVIGNKHKPLEWAGVTIPNVTKGIIHHSFPSPHCFARYSVEIPLGDKTGWLLCKHSDIVVDN